MKQCRDEFGGGAGGKGMTGKVANGILKRVQDLEKENTEIKDFAQ